MASINLDEEMSEATRHIACTCCRERKVRCDGAQPICKRCARYGGECVYKRPGWTKRDTSVSPNNLNDVCGKISIRHIACASSDSKIVQSRAQPASPQIEISLPYLQTTNTTSCDNAETMIWSGLKPVQSTVSDEDINNLMLLDNVFASTASNNLNVDTSVFDDLADYDASEIFATDSVDSLGTFGPFKINTLDVPNEEFYNEPQNMLWPSIERSSSGGSTSLSLVGGPSSYGSEGLPVTIVHDLYVMDFVMIRIDYCDACL